MPPSPSRRARAGGVAAAVLPLLLLACLAVAAPARAAAIPPSEQLDPQATLVVQQIASTDSPPLDTLAPENARKLPSAQEAAQVVQSRLGVQPFVEPVGSVKTRLIPRAGGHIVTRVYTPAGTGPFPVLVYYHGGGWTIASPQTYDASARALTNAAKYIVVSVAYRQAPEHPFPAATNDAYTAYKWVSRNAAKLGGISGKVAVGGESAGGNLAAVTALRARDDGFTAPIHQLLVYPITNYGFDTASYREHAKDIPLGRAQMRYFWAQYLRRPADGKNPYASPLRAKSLRRLPSATVITDQNDPLRSEGRAYAQRLARSGVTVDLKHYDGVMHEFFGMPAVIDKAKDAVAAAGADLQAAAAR